MSCLVSNEQVRMYDEVRGYSGDEVYLRTLERAYKCLRKVLISSVIFIVICSVLSVCITGLSYRYISRVLPNDLFRSALHLCLSLCIFVLITLLVVLAGVVVAERFSDSNELDFLNGVFMGHATYREVDDCGKVILNSNGVFFSMSSGKLAKLTEYVPEGIRVELHEYYEISDLCILKPISEYIVYNDKGNVIGKVRDGR